MRGLAMLRTAVWVVIGAGVLVVAAAPLRAHAQGNLVGAYAGTTTQAYIPGSNPTLVVDLIVAGVASQFGQFTAVGQQTVDLRTGIYTGSYTFTTPNGDTLTATTQGMRLLCVSGGVYTLEERIEVTGGTGSFAGATGSANGLGAFGSLGNQAALVFKGALDGVEPFTPGRRR